MDLVPLTGVDQRAERDLVDRGVADRQVGGLGREPLDEVVVDALVHEVPAGGHADLALVEERPAGGQADRLVDVGVVEHDQGRVAAQFQVGALEVLAGQLADPATRPRSSR